MHAGNHVRFSQFRSAQSEKRGNKKRGEQRTGKSRDEITEKGRKREESLQKR